ncbi:hypothetical protein [Pseudomonas putida]|uniref:hypothetical protein n=1 Tax=Pseudomonas putida TaxID=303 RepID=UPI003905E0CE
MNDVNFDVSRLSQLRHECELHNIDLSRVKIVPVAADSRRPEAKNEDGVVVAGAYREYVVQFDKPLVDVSNFCPEVPAQKNARSVYQAEGLALLWAKRIQIAERVTVRHGAVVGWDSTRINREPITAEEMDRYRARHKEAALQAKIARELRDAVKERQAQANQRAHDDLAARYPGTVVAPREKNTPVDVPGPVASLKGKSK